MDRLLRLMALMKHLAGPSRKLFMEFGDESLWGLGEWAPPLGKGGMRDSLLLGEPCWLIFTMETSAFTVGLHAPLVRIYNKW